MPTAADKTTVDVGVTSTKTKVVGSRSPQDQIKSFEVAVFEYKDDPSEKNMSNIEKVLQVIGKVSDLNFLASNSSFLIDLKWLLSLGPPSSSALSLLHKLVTAVPAVRGVLRDRLCLVSTLTQLLSEMSATNHGKITKLLDLLRFVTYGIQIVRQEAFLYDLVPKLLVFINGKDAAHLPASLSILICLCENNYIVKKYVLSLLTAEDRKTLFVKCNQDLKLQVFNDYLDLVLSSANLSSLSSSTKLLEKLEQRLAIANEVFRAAYAEDDCITLLIVIDFLRGLISNDPETKASSVAQLIQQVIVGADYSEATNTEAIELLFSYVRTLVRFSSDVISITEIVTKSVSLRLDSKNTCSLSSAQAVLLLNDVLKGLTRERSELTSTSLQNIRLQFDTVVPSLCDVITSLDGIKTLTDENVDTVSAVFDTLISVASTENWADMISTGLTGPRGIMENLKKLSETSKCVGSVLTKLFKLAELTAPTSSTWDSFLKEFLHDGVVSALLTECLRAKCHPGSVADILKALSKCRTVDEPSDDGDISPFAYQKQSRFDKFNEDFEMNSVTEMLEDCLRVLGKTGTTEETVCKTLELNELKMTSQLRHLESLKASLTAADEQIARQNVRAIQLENEVSKYDQLTKALWKRIDVSQKELKDVRKQFQLFQDEAASYRRKVSSELGEKDRELQELEEIKEKLITKYKQYKDQTTILQNTIKEHQQIREELDEKLKLEAKISQDLTITLNKREEKLRKKERQLEDEMTEREKLEKEVDRLSKEVASLQSLTNLQKEALKKKDKQLQENVEEMNDLKKIHEQIFSLSKLKASK